MGPGAGNHRMTFMLIDDYVAELRSALSGPSGPKRDMVVEARDSLLDCADAYEAEGLPRAEAERLAVEEFGPVHEVAPGYQEELAACAGRRLGLLLFTSVPVTVLIWALVWHLHPGDASLWADRPGWYMTVSRLLDTVQLGAAVYAGLAVLALGRGARWVRRPRLVTGSLGVMVWLMLVTTALLGTLLARGSYMAAGAPLVTLANLVTHFFAGVQIYCATRCVMLGRRARPRGAARSR